MKNERDERILVTAARVATCVAHLAQDEALEALYAVTVAISTPIPERAV